MIHVLEYGVIIRFVVADSKYNGYTATNLNCKSKAILIQFIVILPRPGQQPKLGMRNYGHMFD